MDNRENVAKSLQPITASIMEAIKSLPSVAPHDPAFKFSFDKREEVSFAQWGLGVWHSGEALWWHHCLG
jgi:hypothetical protein